MDSCSREKILEFYKKLSQKYKPAEPEDSFSVEDFPEGHVSLDDYIEQLHSETSELQVYALKELGRITENNGTDISKAFQTIMFLLRTSDEEDVRVESARTLGKTRNIIVADKLFEAFENDESILVKEAAIKALGFIRAQSYMSEITDILEDIYESPERLRKAAVFAIGRFDPDISLGFLADILVNDADVAVRCEAAGSIAICMLKLDKENADLIVRKISSQIDHRNEVDEDVRIEIINAVTVAEGASSVDELLMALKNDPSPRVRGQAANALAHFFDPRIERALLASLNKEEGGVKKRMALALAQYVMKNPLSQHDMVCEALINIQKLFPKYSYIWKEAVKALPAC